MESIDRLREYVNGTTISTWTRNYIDQHIDAIEFEVNALVDERDLLKRQWEAGVDFDQRLEACADKREDVTLFGVDYTALPVDADGVPIHVGDVMENIVCPPVHREVTGVGVECFYGWDDGNGRYSQFDVVCYRHHHAPTVEDMLREFGKRWDDPAHYAKGELVETFAEKLRLAGDE